MISDSIDNSHLYPFGSVWAAAFAFIRSLTPDAATGKQVIMGDRMYAGIDVYDTKARAAAKLETHRKYVDIQLLLSGEEIIEVFPKETLVVSEPYHPERDFTFYQVPSIASVQVRLTPGRFVVLFPDDAHMPCLSAGPASQSVKKVVVKVAVELLVGAGKN